MLALACDKKKEEPTPPAPVTPKIEIPSESQAVFSQGISIQAGTSAQSQTVKFSTTAAWSTDVTDTKASTWLSVQPTSGSAGTVNMTVTAQPNTGAEDREASVTIKCGTVTQKFTVKQAGNPSATVAVESVSLNKADITLEPGKTETLTATVKPDNATDKTVTWSTSDANVATVDNGKVTAIKEGEASIIATASGKSAVCKVKVQKVDIAVEAISLNKTELILVEGADETLIATVTPENATDKTVTWSTSNVEIATVADGKVTAVKKGEATITAKAGEKEATCIVTVTASEEVPFSVSPTSVEVPVEGGSFDVTVTCSTTYHLSSKPDWVTEKSVNGKVHTFEVAANTGTEGRNGVVVFCDDKGTCLPCNVKQKAKEEEVPFSVSPTSVEVAAEGGTFDVTVTCSTTYHLSSKPDWVTEIAVNGKIHTFEVATNTGTEDRSGVVVFCDDKGTCLPCNVKQKGVASGGGDGDGFDWTKEFYHQSLFMRFTATWCGWCPLMSEAVKMAQDQKPGKIQALNLHTSGSNLYFQDIQILESTYGISVYPSGVIDGRKRIENQIDASTITSNIVKAFDQFENAKRAVTTMGWTSSLSGQSLSIDLDIYVKEAGTYKVTVVLTESGIVGEQADNRGDQSHYQHNDIARLAVSGMGGDSFNVSNNNHIEKKSYSVTIPSSYKKENMKIVVYVQRAYGDGVSRIEGTDYSGWYVDNCNSGKVGGNMGPAIAKEGSGGENEDVIGGNPINW